MLTYSHTLVLSIEFQLRKHRDINENIHGRHAMRFTLGLTALSLIFSLSTSISAIADVSLPSVLSDSMVLQRDIEIPVWGWAEPGESITVQIGKHRKSTFTDSDGKWSVKLKPMKAGGPYEMVVTGNNRIVLKDILIGELWICSGQSNMELALSRVYNAENEIANSAYPQIRLFSVSHIVAQEPQEDCEGSWSACSPEISRDFSAVGYFFGRRIHQAAGVPVGLIDAAWGGTPIEAWTSLPALEANPMASRIVEDYYKTVAKYPEMERKHQKKLEDYEKACKKAEKEGKKLPYKPLAWRMKGHPGYRRTTTGLYNSMIHPLVPLAIRGAIWYQGESNTGRGYQYASLFPEMIKDWRKAWGQGAFPFLFVQLAGYHAPKPQPTDSHWAELRESQTKTLSLARTGMAVTIDIGDAKNIHPRNKQDVGKRLALAALKTVYRHNVIHSGPIYKSMRREKGKIRLRFKHIGGGLVAKDGSPLGFAVAGKDKKFHWACAEIDGDEIVVWCDEVKNPAAVRYAWDDNPICNIYNKAGLPASPFRTDNWPGISYDKR
jgi:sialate O-acetylesterase